jgi:hypothetical protein
MLIHVDDLITGMQLGKDIELKAGSYLITRKELPGGKLTEDVLGKIRRFASQLIPEKDKVYVVGDDLVYQHLKELFQQDLGKVIQLVESGRDFPNFLAESELRGKVLRVMEKLVANPDVIRNMYDLKMQARSTPQQQDYILEHSIRVTLLGIAIGLKARLSIISLFNYGMAAMLHDMGILQADIYPDLEKLDDLGTEELEEFIEEHQRNSEKIFSAQQLTMLPHTRAEIMDILANHHRPDLKGSAHKTTFLLYLAELVDEMISTMPHKVRYNFTQVQKHILGKRFHGRLGLMNLLLGLIKLFRGQGMIWVMVEAIAGIFGMQELLVENYEEKLKKILDFCPFKCASPYPVGGGNVLPRSIYCKNSTQKDFFCDHLGQNRIEIQNGKGNMKSYLKCATLNDQLHDLNKEGRKKT